MLSTTITVAMTTNWLVELKDTGYIFGPEGYKSKDFLIADRFLDVLSYLSIALRRSKAQDPYGR